MAVTLNLPILAFRVDPEHPWPPRHVETEPEARTRLETFLQRVSAKVTVNLFTTPESLEVAITHALVHFVSQRRPEALPRYAKDRLVRISRAESLRYSPDSVIKVGHAPDGASLLLSVRRTIPATEAMEGEQPTWTGGWTESTPKSIVLLRPFIEEGLERLDGVRYVIEYNAQIEYGAPIPEARTLIDTEDSQQAIEKWVAILSSEHDQELERCSYKIRVPRSSVIRFILDVVDEVAEMHDRQEIHGDIKPSNTLISRNGKTLIDEGNLRVGDISPTVTLGWSPSEQLLRQPLSCAADVFPLGQMLLYILDGEPLGKEVCYRLPGGKKATLIEDPSVYISDGSIPPSTRNEWGNRPFLIDEGKGTLTVGWVMHTQQPDMSWSW